MCVCEVCVCACEACERPKHTVPNRHHRGFTGRGRVNYEVEAHKSIKNKQDFALQGVCLLIFPVFYQVISHTLPRPPTWTTKRLAYLMFFLRCV